MTRLIDADDLKDWSEIVPLTDDGGIDINDFDEKLKSMPTIDAVPVIRCKDCKHWESMPSSTAAPEIHRCRYWRHIGTVAYDFCGRAERKEE